MTHTAENDAGCYDWPVASVERINDEPRWLDTPPQTHVALDLLAEPGAREFLATRYEIGEPCPRQPGVVHATCIVPPAAWDDPDPDDPPATKDDDPMWGRDIPPASGDGS